MSTIISIIQIILSVSLSVLIFLQAKGVNENSSNILSTTGTQRRGWEKAMFNLTVAVTVLFLLSSIVSLLVK
jgi:protein translocase SecG subunit